MKKSEGLKLMQSFIIQRNNEKYVSWAYLFINNVNLFIYMFDFYFDLGSYLILKCSSWKYTKESLMSVLWTIANDGNQIRLCVQGKCSIHYTIALV